MNSSGFRVQSSRLCTIRIPHSAFRNSKGFAYVALIVAIVIIGISLGAAGKYWSYTILRDKEEELLFRGEQYRLAIERYYLAMPGRRQFPPSIEELLKDSRTPAGTRHLRQRYKDPFTNEDFVPVRDPRNQITGVRSPSDKAPLKQGNFSEANKDFEGKEKYSDWQFVVNVALLPGLAPGLPGGDVRRYRPIKPIKPPIPPQSPHF